MQKNEQPRATSNSDITARLQAAGASVARDADLVDANLQRISDLIRALRIGIGRLTSSGQRVPNPPRAVNLSKLIDTWVENCNDLIDRLGTYSPAEDSSQMSSDRRTLVRALRTSSAMATVAGDMVRGLPAEDPAPGTAAQPDQIATVRNRTSAAVSRMLPMIQLADEIAQRVSHIHEAIDIALEQDAGWQRTAEQVILGQVLGVAEAIGDTSLTSTDACTKTRDVIAAAAEAPSATPASVIDITMPAKNRAALQSLSEQLDDIEAFPWASGAGVTGLDLVQKGASELRSALSSVLPGANEPEATSPARESCHDLAALCEQMLAELGQLKTSVRRFVDVPLVQSDDLELGTSQPDLGPLLALYTMNDERDIHRKVIQGLSEP